MAPYFLIRKAKIVPKRSLTKIQIWGPGFDRIRDLYYEVRSYNKKSLWISIKIDAYTNLDTKKMTCIIFNCPVKKLCNINLYIDGVLEHTNDRPDNRKNRENRKLTQKQPYFLKLDIKSGSNKPNRVTRWGIIWLWYKRNIALTVDFRLSETIESSDKTISEMSFSPKIVGQNKKICNLLDRKFFLKICSLLVPS